MKNDIVSLRFQFDIKRAITVIVPGNIKRAITVIVYNIHRKTGLSTSVSSRILITSLT